MKNLLFSFLVCLSFTSCSQKKSEEIPAVPAESTGAVAPVPESAGPKAAENSNTEGKSLIDGADCLSCHTAAETLIGPSYEAVAKKYSEKDTDMLADKIINGGSGNWGTVPMSAHPGLSKENAKKMVAYILSLKK